jgi:glycosyltransferase involved in cell wall biosynthesis
LIPDLRNHYNLDITTLFFYHGEETGCPTIEFFRTNELPIATVSVSKFQYIEDQIKELLKIIKNQSITVLVANLVNPAYYAGKYLKKYSIPAIGVLHSNDKFYKGVVQKFIDGSSSDSLPNFVVVSDLLLGLASKSNYHKSSLSKIPCGTPSSKNIANPPTNHCLKIIYAGRLEIEQKQILKLSLAFIDAAKENPQLEFTIYGSGNEKENVKNLILKSQYQDRITFGGEVTPDKIMNEMAKHHVFTLMSDYEGMPVALMEAMACGLVPVCLEEESGVKEIIQHGMNGFIVKNRGKDYQEKLSFLQQNTDEWKRMSENAIKTIKEKYSSEITHKQWADLIKSFEGIPAKKIKIPTSIKIKGQPLAYGDIRKPKLVTRFNNTMSKLWFSFRLFIRPRARLRALFQK